MVNIKGFKNFKINESVQDDIKDVIEMVFADLSDKYKIDEYYIQHNDIDSVPAWYKVADVSFKNGENGEFNTAEFTEKIEQLKEYLGESYKFRYSYRYRSSLKLTNYLKIYPENKNVTWFCVSIYNL